MREPDRPFLRRLYLTIVLLAIAMLVLGGLIHGIDHPTPRSHTPVASKTAQAPATPMHGVYEGKSGQAAIDAAHADAANAQQTSVAYGGTTSGKAIYAHLCHTCHTAGIAGAPRLGDRSAWAPRIAKGINTLVKHALDGYTGPDGNRMPAKGGDPELSKTQVANTVQWMVTQSQ